MKHFISVDKNIKNKTSRFPGLISVLLFLCLFNLAHASTGGRKLKGEHKTSSVQEAIEYLSNCDLSTSAAYWPNVNSRLFVQNVKENIENPISIYPGDGTYFCAYSAITYLLLQDDPLGYTKFITALYTNGTAKFKGVLYSPSAAVKKEAGLLKNRGIMDIHPADQLWFLTLAGHYKGYLNIFNRKYDPGDESKFWASVNYAKFNRIAKKLLNHGIQARGTDFFRPWVQDMYSYLTKKLSEGSVVLYINNRIVHKKNHTNLKLAVPTHFIALENMKKVGDLITLVYWDNGGKTLIQLSPAFLKRIVYGITVFIKPATDAG